MKDEEYLFFSDARDKKNIARSARNQRTHNGKRGRVKLPSDYLTKKELKAMNGDVKSYRLNDPMNWKEFKSMPNDLKRTYIKLIREKYSPYDKAIAEMFGVHVVTFSNEMKHLGMCVGKHRNGMRKMDKEGWLKWSKGIPATKDDISEEEIIEPELVCECEEVVQANEETAVWREPILEEHILRKAVPCSGNMTFNGAAEAALQTVLDLLGGGKCPLEYYMGDA